MLVRIQFVSTDVHTAGAPDCPAGVRFFALAWLLVFFLALVTPPGAFAQQSIQYVYDDLGRLVAVTDLNGDTAVYHYDAVGNILSIDRYASTIVSIITFSPSSGPVGATVTIHGTGFSATPAQDTVTFNGTAATVSSATTTTLIVTVPIGATTGPIGVTAPGGSATSSVAFTVLLNTGSPTITNFTPSVGIAGTAITVAGTNFEPVAVDDRVTLNQTLASVATASTTALGMTSPQNAMGGHITVATPRGTAVSTADFFVPPSPYTPADVLVTDRVTIGATKDLSIGTPGKIALLLFEGATNQGVSVLTTASTFPTTCPGLTLAIEDPRAATITSVTNSCGTNTVLIDNATLPSNGTYTILFAVSANETGTATLSLSDVTDVQGTITPDGTGVPVSLMTPRQNARLTFFGTAGQAVSAWTSSSTFPSTVNTLTLAIKKPDGTTLASAYNNSGNTVFLDQTVLPVSGTYTLLLDPAGTNTGTATLKLFTATNVTGTIAADGTGVPVSITTPGQNAALTFAGTAGQAVSAWTSSSTFPSTYNTLRLSIKKPDGTTLASAFNISDNTVFLDQTVLPVSGTYTLLLDPAGSNTGTATLRLYTVTDWTGTIVVNGGGVNVSITTPGQNASLTFNGTSGQQITVHVTNNATGGVTVRLLKPDGTQLTSASSAGSFTLPAETLTVTGTYTVVVDPSSSNTGTVTISVTSP